MNMSLIRTGRHALVATAVLLLAACGVSPQKVTVPVVEKNIYNAIESYAI